MADVPHELIQVILSLTLTHYTHTHTPSHTHTTTSSHTYLADFSSTYAQFETFLSGWSLADLAARDRLKHVTMATKVFSRKYSEKGRKTRLPKLGGWAT